MKSSFTFPAGSGPKMDFEGQLPIADEEILSEKKQVIEQSRRSLTGTRKIRVAMCQHWWYEYLGAMMLSAGLKNEGHEVECFIHNLDELVEAVKRNEFDLICMTLMTSDIGWGQEYLERIKAANPAIPILCGGSHPTYHKGFINEDGVDMLCVGEGDHAILEVADAIANGESWRDITGLIVKDELGMVKVNPLRPMITDLDSLPFPDRDMYRSKYRYFKDYPIVSMVATRGCPYRCNYCEIPSYMDMYETRKFYYRSPENILAEIESVKQAGIDPNLIVFVDSTFNLNKKWTVNFLEKYKVAGVKFSCNFTAGLINQATVDALADTKLCHSVRFAVEVGNEEMRRDVLNKNVKNEALTWAADALHAKGIPIYVYIMFGVPYDSEEKSMETIELTRRLRPEYVYPSIFMPYRGLGITDKALEGGYLTEEDLDMLDDPRFQRLKSVMRLPDLNKIINLHNFSIALIRYPWSARFLMKFVAWKNNFLFNSFFLFCAFLQGRRFVRIGIKRTLVEGYHHAMER